MKFPFDFTGKLNAKNCRRGAKFLLHAGSSLSVFILLQTQHIRPASDGRLQHAYFKALLLPGNIIHPESVFFQVLTVILKTVVDLHIPTSSAFSNEITSCGPQFT